MPNIAHRRHVMLVFICVFLGGFVCGVVFLVFPCWSCFCLLLLFFTATYCVCLTSFHISSMCGGCSFFSLSFPNIASQAAWNRMENGLKYEKGITWPKKRDGPRPEMVKKTQK